MIELSAWIGYPAREPATQATTVSRPERRRQRKIGRWALFKTLLVDDWIE